MKFYRYEIIQYASGGQDDYYSKPLFPDIRLRLIEMELHKETPKGYWIGYGEPGRGYASASQWVSKTSKKRYAYPTKEEAMHNFKCRTERRLKILQAQVDKCKTGLHLIESALKNPELS